MQAQQQQMLAQQQQNQELQHQMLEYQKQSSAIHQSLVDRLTTTDTTIALFQQSKLLQEDQLNLLATNKNVSVVSAAANSKQLHSEKTSQSSVSTPSAGHNLYVNQTSSVTPTQSAVKPVAITPSMLSSKSTQTTLTSNSNDTIQLSSSEALKTGGPSSRSPTKGSTKDL